MKTVGKVLQDAGKIEQYQQILDAQAKMLEMQKKIYDLEEEIRSLNDRLKIKDDLCFENNAYWIKKAGMKDGPFCSGCWDSEHKLMRLHTVNMGLVRCPKCKSSMNLGEYQEPRTRIAPWANRL